MIAMGFMVGVYVIRKLSTKNGLDPEKMMDLTFWCLMVGFLGSRILFIITRFSYFMSDPLAMFKIWEGGLVFFGGPLAVVPFLYWYVKKHKLPIWKAMDTMVPGLVVAHAFGRIGCLSAGCCYGKPTGTEYGIRLYSDLVDKPLQGIPLHPTQIYESVSLFILFFCLLALFKRKKFDGQITLTYFMIYPIIRSVVEIFRGDLIRGFVIDGVLSTSQFISILVFLAAATALYFRLKSDNPPMRRRPLGRAT
jgi:phosphatidylglycerol:prolipoprotein diacylglycerol transferase